MSGLNDLNDFNQTFTLEFADLRGTVLTFDRSSPDNQVFLLHEGKDHIIPLGIDILEYTVNDPLAELDLEFSIDLTGLPLASVTWPTLPSGVTTSQVGRIFKVSGMMSTSDWNSIKTPIITSNTEPVTDYVYTAAITYTPSGVKSWSVNLTITYGIDLVTTASLTSLGNVKYETYHNLDIDTIAHAIGTKCLRSFSNMISNISLYNDGIKVVPGTFSTTSVIDYSVLPHAKFSGRLTGLVDAVLYSRSNANFIGKFSTNILILISPKGTKVRVSTLNTTPIFDFVSTPIRINYLISDNSYFNYSTNTTTAITNNPTINNDYIGYELQTHTVELIPSTTSAINTLSTNAIQYKFQANDYSAGDIYGSAVSISSDGGTMAVGSPNDSNSNGTGSVYVYTRSGSIWSLQSKLFAFSGAAQDRFGSSVALSNDGNTLVVGSPYDDISGITDCGSVYVYTRSGSSWLIETRLQASDKASQDYFGNSVAISSDGNTVAVGAYWDDISGIADAGSVYVYTRSGSIWTQQTRLQASDNGFNDVGPNDNYGSSVALSSDGNTLAIGSPYDNNSGGADAGSVYICTRTGSTWSTMKRLQGSDAAAGDRFGNSVSLSSDGLTLAVGAYYDDLPSTVDAGSVYIFTRSGSTWTQQTRLESDEPFTFFSFGSTVSLSSDGLTLAVGSISNVSTGPIYIFTKSGSTWYLRNKINDSRAISGDNFGYNISLSGDGTILIIGASGDDTNGLDTGAAYISYMVTSSFNSTTKVLTLTGLKNNLNFALNNLVLTPATGYASDFTLTYRYYNPPLSSHIDRIQPVIHV